MMLLLHRADSTFLKLLQVIVVLFSIIVLELCELLLSASFEAVIVGVTIFILLPNPICPSCMMTISLKYTI